MKNAFFADRRDFFKYDLLLEILEKSGFLHQLTLLPMLTPSDHATGGSLFFYRCDCRRPELYTFLKRCIATDRRDIRELRTFFSGFVFRYSPYNDTTYLTRENRHRYFLDVPGVFLRQALVFLDPDNGLEIASMNSRNEDRYVKYAELQQLLGRMDDASVLAVYQHLPRQDRRTFFKSLKNRIHNKLKTQNLVCISDNNVCFVICVKDYQRFHLVHRPLEAYAKRLRLRLPFDDSYD